MTNREFSVVDSIFKESCKAVQLEPTSRQASKYRNRKGRAFLKGKVKLKEVGGVLLYTGDEN